MNPHLEFLLSAVHVNSGLHPEHLADLRGSGVTDETRGRTSWTLSSEELNEKGGGRPRPCPSEELNEKGGGHPRPVLEYLTDIANSAYW
jgi:hypothetical protein